VLIPANGNYKIGLVSDIHADTHDHAAVNLACKLLHAYKPDIFINLGDVVNMDPVSSYVSEPRKIAKLQQELDISFDVMKQFNDAVGKARKMFLRGNHEYRLERALRAKLPGLTHIDNLKLTSVLRLDELGYEYDEDGIMLGQRVQFIHGWSARKWSGTSPRSALEQLGYTHSVVQGHSHRQSIISKSTARGPVFGVEVGHLSDYRKMDYLSGPPDWQRGIALLDFQDGKPAFEIIPFHGNIKLTAIWRGKMYRS
jgi:predicted phosphodiesterase